MIDTIYYWTGVTTLAVCFLIGLGFLLVTAVDVLQKKYGWMGVVVSYWMNRKEFEEWKQANRNSGE